MASREERMQQRLRGSQRRQVKDVDFGLVFSAAPALPELPEPAPSNREATQPELSQVPSTRRTPTTRSRAQPTSNNAAENRLPVMRSGTVDANISAKRRKLDTDVEPSSSRSTRSSQVLRPDVYALPDEEAPESSALEASNVLDESEVVAVEFEPQPQIEPEPELPVSQRRLRAARTPSLPPQLAEEVTESPADAPGSGHRSRIGTAGTVSTSSQLHIVQDSSILETPVRRKRKRGEATSPVAHSVKQPNLVSSTKETISAVEEVDELSPDQPIRRQRKTKIVVAQESSIVEEASKISTEQEEAEEIDLQAAAVLKKNRRQKASQNLQREPSPDLDEPTVEEPVQVKRRKIQKSSPVKQSHPKMPSKETKQASKKAVKKAKLRGGAPIPVPVHRLTNQPLYDENEADADVLNSEIPYARRPGVNAIDVLSQVCRESIVSLVETCKEGQQNTETAAAKREYRTKWQALQSFGDELQARLLGHTLNLDNAYSLERRVREQQRKKLALRDDILRVRAERQQIALQMDEIRIKHESEANKAQERNTLNTAAYDIELAVERGKATPPIVAADGTVEKAGLDVLLKRVAGEVSNKGDSGGLLKRIKDFNMFLERAASALESKKV